MLRNFLLGLTFILFSCNNSGDSSTDVAKQEQQPYQTKELQVDNGKEEGWGANIRLSIVSVVETDTANLYSTLSTYEGKKLGFLVLIPKQKEGNKGFGSGIVLKTLGSESDNLLRTLVKLYKQKLDTTLKFRNTISVTFVNLDEFAKSIGSQDGGQYKTQNQYKLFFEDENETAELYLNINPSEHWIELKEKDEEYRPVIIKFLKQ